MEVIDKQRASFISTCDRKNNQFRQNLLELKKQFNTLNETFLEKLSHTLELKHSLSKEQVTSISIIFSLAAIATKHHEEMQQKPFNASSIQKIQDLSRFICPEKGPKKFQIVQNMLIGWITQIWDKLMHFSFYNNFIDLSFLFYFIGDSLLYFQHQLQRLSKILLSSVAKIKSISPQTLNLTLLILDYFIQNIEGKKVAYELKIRFKILKILFLSKIDQPNQQQIKQMQSHLLQFYQNYLDSFIETLKRIEETGMIKQEDIVWDRFLTTILTYYHRLPQLHDIARQVIIEMVSFRIDMQTMKLMIKQLEITNEQVAPVKWKWIFDLLQIALVMFDKPKQAVLFLNNKSYLKMPLQHTKNFFIELNVKNQTKTYLEQKFMFSIQSNDNQNKNKSQSLWVTAINQVENQLKLIILIVQNKNIIEKQQKIVKWKQYAANMFRLQFTNKNIRFQINGDTSNSLTIDRCIKTPQFIVIGDENNMLGTSIKQFLSLESYLQPKIANTDSCFRLNLGNKQYVYVGLRKKVLPSFPEIAKAVGDLDIFLLLISHVFKKMKKNPKAIEMIRCSLALMESLVQAKGVKHMRLNSKQKQQRTNAILCLCWQCSHQSQNAIAVLELLRVLSLRGVSNFQDELQVLSNFVFWRQFQWEYQKLIIMKIKQIFMQIRGMQYYHKFVHKYCKRILMQAALYYREEDTLNILQQKNQILKIHYQFMSLAKEQLEQHIYSKKYPELVYEFMEFLLKMMYLTLSRRNNTNNFQTFDITFTIQLSILIRNISDCLTQWKGKDQSLFQLIKNSLEICKVYEVEEAYFQQKNLRIYLGEKGFVVIDESIIKENLFFVAYKLITFKQGILNCMVQQEEYGAPELTCISWQRQFFDLIILKNHENQFMFEDKPQVIQKVLLKKKKLSLKYLSPQQNKIYLRIYLRHKDIFPEIEFTLSTHFWKIISVKEVLQIIKSQILFNAKQFTQHTANSKAIQSLQMKDLGLFRDKILNMLSSCDDLVSHQGLMILKTFQLIYPSSLTQTYRTVFFHFILKNIIQKTKELVSSNESTISVKSHVTSHTDKQTKPSASQISYQQAEYSVVLTRQEYIKCIQFYLNHLKANDIMVIKGITDMQEGMAHFQNYKINIIAIMNQLASVQHHIMSKLKNYYFFLKEFLLQLSKYYLQILEIVPIFREGVPRKGSRHHLQFPNVNLKEQSKMMYLKFTQQRKHFLLKVQQIWEKVEERNKYFWSNFLGRQMEYSLHDATGPMNERYLLKKSTKKAKLQLPRMIRNSIIKSTSIVSEKYDFNETESVSSSILDDAKLYRKEPNNCLSSNNESQPKKQRKSNSFIVLLITNSKIYQGILTVTAKKMTFKQTQEINQVLYKRIYASDGEKRSPEECIRQNYKFQEELSFKCKAIAKRYLFHDLALELHTRSRSYLFSFINKGHREAVTMIIQKTMKIVYRNSINDEVKRIFQKWQSGKISNYTYLMKLNDVSGRSFNDLSQYYVFPWTVTNFNDEMDLSFFKNKQNFRDMSIPVGKISKTKWENIRGNFQRSKNDEIGGIKPFLYGSFYSNPAIVSNFLIRINPFASQHFQLQSNQFDLADRLFYSIQDSYRSLTMCSSDFKELIPEFYYFPQFLKNRNKYNLGSRQNKDIVNNVLMPKWAQDEYQFVFRMKKLLQSSHVTNGLHLWIDLIFGVYSKRQYALKADNLFLQNLYIDSYNAYINDKNKEVNMYYKQFGQVPVSVFTSNHKPTMFSGNYLDLINHQQTKFQQHFVNKNNQNGKLLKIDFSSRFIFFLFEKQIRVYLDQKFGQKDYISVNGQFQGGSLFSWQIIDEKYKKRALLLVHRKKTFELLGFQVKKNLFGRYSLDGGEVLPFKHRVQLFNVYDNQIICSQGKNIYIYKKIEEEVEQEFSAQNNSIVASIAKIKFLFKAVAQITQHKSRVLFISVSDKGMLVSIDQQNRVFIMQIGTMTIDIFNFFEIRGIYCQQTIQQILLHNLGFIIMRTHYDRVLMYSFLGDKIVDKILCFKKVNNNVNQQKVQTMALWNQQFCEIVIGTNIGNLWKLDLFAIRQMEQIEETLVWIEKIHLNKDGFRKEGLIKASINRIGRHSLMLVYGENTKFYVIKSERWDEIKKKQLQAKKGNSFW